MKLVIEITLPQQVIKYPDHLVYSEYVALVASDLYRFLSIAGWDVCPGGFDELTFSVKEQEL